MSKPIAALFIVLVFISSATAYAGGRAYINGKLVEEKPAPKKFNEGDFIINKKGLKHEVLLELGWGNGDYEVGLAEEDLYYGPCGFAVDNNGDIYIGDKINMRIIVYDKHGKFVRAIKDDNGGNILTLGDDNKIYTYDNRVNVFDKKGELLSWFYIAGKATNKAVSKLIVISGDLFLFTYDGYQKVETIREDDSRGSIRYFGELGEYKEGYPYEDMNRHKNKKLRDIDPQYIDIGLGDKGVRPYSIGKNKQRPIKFGVITNDNKFFDVIHIFDNDGYKTRASVAIYGTIFGELFPFTLSMDDKNNLYQMVPTFKNLKIVRWGS